MTYTIYEGYKYLQNGDVAKPCRVRRKRSSDECVAASEEIPSTEKRTYPKRVAAMHPLRLSQYDIVLTSFEVLAAELPRTDSPYANGASTLATTKFFADVDISAKGLETKTLRREKKYRVSPSPLMCLNWRRVVLDEAQLVEGTTTAAAKMADRLHSHHRLSSSCMIALCC